MAFFFNNNTLFFLCFFFFFFSIFCCSFPSVYSLSTVSISETSNHTVICALLQPNNNLSCIGIDIKVNPRASFITGIVSGNGFVCSLMSGSSSPFSSTSILSCWRFSINGTITEYKRLYQGPHLREVSAGNSHICGVNGTNYLHCWQWPRFRSDPSNFQGQNFSSIAVGEHFVCGLSSTTSLITCLGDNARVVGNEPKGYYSKIAAGFNHACAISMNNNLECWGDMKGEKPTGKFSSLALGENRSCGLRTNGSVSCWGENNFTLPENLRKNYFISIEAKKSVFCGISTKNYSLFCWGNEILESQNSTVFNDVTPGTCTRECPSGTTQLPGYGSFCKEGYVCYPSIGETSTPTSPFWPPLSPSPAPQPGKKSSKNGLSDEMIAFIVLGSVGSLSLVLVCCYFLSRFCNIRGRKVHDSGPLDDSTGTHQSHNRTQQTQQTQQSQPAQPVLEKRLSHLISIGNGAHLEEFSLQVLLDATGNFSEDHKIGTGSFGSVYHGKLGDGREVAIKRAEVSTSTTNTPGLTRKQEDKDSAFLNELDFLSRLNHKHLVRLLGFYEDDKERVLVYEFMENGSLNDHLHRLETSPLSSSWAARIKVALDAARGIEYLHVYSIPPVIHRDIKSSNILLDATWTAKVSDFGLSLMGPEEEGSYLSLLAAGTVGYIDPEYYRLQQLTSKSDVYSFGVVLLELLSGLKAIHKNENGVPRNVVDYMVPCIVRDEIHRVLDPKVPPPTPFEIEAVRYIGYIAADCVALEGRDRPTMLEIVGYLEKAWAACLARPPRSRSPSIESLA